MQSLADRLATLSPSDRQEALEQLTEAEAEALLHDWDFHARPDQIAPPGDWDIWLVLAGRGWGKTRCGSEWVKQQVEAGKRRIAFIAETAADARDVLVEGDSGILNIYPEDQRPLYEPSKRRVTWPNGAIATLYNATEPDQLRGPQHDAAWCDELAKWRYARETWDQLQFGMRLGDHPQQIITTTPRPIELIKAIVAGEEGRVAVTKGRTMDNRSNLAKAFVERIQKRYGGTRLGRQELNAEILGDLPGALWTMSTLDGYREKAEPELERILVSVDHAVSEGDEANEHGIIVGGCAGIADDQTGYVLEDASMEGSPRDWAKRAISLYRSWGADGIVVEVNQGGDLVSHTLRTVDPNVNIIEVRASRGKHVRAEPVASLYEQGRIRHIGSFPELESQMTQMTTAGFQGEGSPDRVDAAVWLFTELFPDMVEIIPDASRFAMPPARSWMS